MEKDTGYFDWDQFFDDDEGTPAPKIGDGAPKYIGADDLDRAAILRNIEEAFSDNTSAVGNFYQGFHDAMLEGKTLDETFVILGGQALMSIGGFFGEDSKLVKLGNQIIQSGVRDMDAERTEIERRSFARFSPERKERFSYKFGGGAASFAQMLGFNYLTSGLGMTAGLAVKTAGRAGQAAALAFGAASEASSEVQEGIDTYRNRTGDENLEHYTAKEAAKEVVTTGLYTAGSTALEGLNLSKLFRLFKGKSKSVVMDAIEGALSEGLTETAQGALNAFIDVSDGTIKWDDMPERLKQELVNGSIGLIVGGNAAGAFSMYHRHRGRTAIREYLRGTVPEKDLNRVSNAVWDGLQEGATDIVARELVYSEELRNKHGDIYNAMQRAIARAADDSGAFADADEATRAQYIDETARMFADQTLAEANQRGVSIDEVLKASDIAFDGEGIALDFNKAEAQSVSKGVETASPLEQAMFKSPLKNVGEFYDSVVKGDENRPRYFSFTTPSGAEVGLPDYVVRHDINGHNLTNTDLENVFENLENIEHYGVSERTTEFAEKSLLLKVDTPQGPYGVAVALGKNQNFISTVFKSTGEKGVDAWIESGASLRPANNPPAALGETPISVVPQGKPLKDIISEARSEINSAAKAEQSAETASPLEQAMFKTNLQTFGEFYDAIVDGAESRPIYMTQNLGGVDLDVPSNAVRHDVNKHGLTKEEFEGVFSAIDEGKITEAQVGDYSRMGGLPVKMVVDVNGKEYGVAFEVLVNDRNLLQTVFVLEDKGWINKKSAQTVANEPQPKNSRLGHSLPEIISNVRSEINSAAKAEQSAETDALEISEDVARQEKEITAEAFKEPAKQTETESAAQSAPVETAETTASTGKKKSESIQDFGEKIAGAKKDLWASWKERMRQNPLEGSDFTLSEVFPMPNWEAAIANGTDTDTLAFIKLIRDISMSVPKKRRDWRDLVLSFRNYARSVLDGDITTEKAVSDLREASPNASERFQLYKDLGYPAFLKTKDYGVKEYPFGSDPWVVRKNRRIVGRYPTREEAVNALRDMLTNAEKQRRETNFNVYKLRDTGEIIIGKKVGRGRYIDLKGGFKSGEEAFKYIDEHRQELEGELKRAKEIKEERGETNEDRTGKQWREDVDVSPEEFLKTFGFRGVQFGNYVGQDLRSKNLNEAYDALLDLSDVLGIPSQAVSLDGTLGLAFGARGTGRALAHYEPMQVVINLTKKRGPGSLAHEWWHALDNYFGAQKTFAGETTDKKDLYMTVSGRSTAHRAEMKEAFDNVVKTVKESGMYQRSLSLDNARENPYWSSEIELTARAFEAYVKDKLAEKGTKNDFLVNILNEKDVENPNRYQYPTKGERVKIDEAFERLFDTMQTEPTEKGYRLYQTSDLVERSGGPKIADDTETVDVVEIPENAVPKFESKKELANFIKGVLGQERSITVKSTGENVLVSNAGINRVAAKSRSEEYNKAFSSIKALLENAKYSGFVEADERHPNVKGQDVYHSAFVIGDKAYSVQFKVDIPKESGTHNYAGHKVSGIEIADSSADGRFTSPMQDKSAIHTISMGVLRGKVKPARLQDGNLFQKKTVKSAVVKGSFDQSERIIRITKNADYSTLPHEFAHYWLTMQKSWYDSGAASEAYQERMRIAFDWLGVKPWKSIGERAHEKFARGYEQYLLNGDLPESPLNPAFKEYDRWLKDVYNSANKPHKEPLTEDMVRFFNSMTTGVLPPPVKTPVNTPPDEELEKPADPEGLNGIEKSAGVKKTEGFEKPAVAAETVRVYDAAEESDAETGRVSQAAERRQEIAVLQGKIAEDETQNVYYTPITLEEQAGRAYALMRNEGADAVKDMIDGKRDLPEGVMRVPAMIAYEEEMLRQGNLTEYARVLKKHTLEQTRRGQEIVSERLAGRDISDLRYWFKRVVSNKKAAAAEKFKTLFQKEGGEKGYNDYLRRIADRTANAVVRAENAYSRRSILNEALREAEAATGKKADLSNVDVAGEGARLYDRIYDAVSQELDALFEITLSAEETKRLFEASVKLKSAYVEHIKSHPNENPPVEVMRLLKEMTDTANAMSPSNALALGVNVWGRAAMLASVKTPILNIESNLVGAITERIIRRARLMSWEKAVDERAIEAYKAYDAAVYDASSITMSTVRAESILEPSLFGAVKGERILTTQGEGRVRAASRLAENIIFKWSLGKPDAMFKRQAFVDNAVLEATKIAKAEGHKGDALKERATHIFNDAVLFNPQTPEGQGVRERSVAAAEIVTYTNDGLISRFSLKARELLNDATGNARIGDIVMPFVKTPANVAALGLEYSLGLGRLVLDGRHILRDVRNRTWSAQSQSAVNAAVRNGIGVLLALLLVAGLEPEDYISTFDLASPKERDLARMKNAPFNSVKIGGEYVSLDYFGPLSAPMTAVLEAQKREGFWTVAYEYVKTALVQASSTIPAIEGLLSAVGAGKELARMDSETLVKEVSNDAVDAVMSRLVPAILGDVAKVIDDHERDMSGASIVDKTAEKLPFVREALPVRFNTATGKPKESSLRQLFFGSRIKKAEENDFIREINRLFESKNAPVISDITRSSAFSDLSADEKAEIRSEFSGGFRNRFGRFIKGYPEQALKMMKSVSYQRASDIRKKQALDKLRRKIVDEIKKKRGIARKK